jgi:hypothetical protein
LWNGSVDRRGAAVEQGDSAIAWQPFAAGEAEEAMRSLLNHSMFSMLMASGVGQDDLAVHMADMVGQVRTHVNIANVKHVHTQ